MNSLSITRQNWSVMALLSVGPDDPRPTTLREYSALYERIEGPCPVNTIRDRVLRLWIEPHPTRARVGALARATLEGWIIELSVTTTGGDATRYCLPIEALEALDKVVEMACSEPELASELARAEPMLYRACIKGSDTFVPLNAMLMGLTKAIAPYSSYLFGVAMPLGGTYVRRKEIPAALSKLKHRQLR